MNIKEMILGKDDPNKVTLKQRASKVVDLLAEHPNFVRSTVGIVDFKSGVMFSPTTVDFRSRNHKIAMQPTQSISQR